MKIKTIIFSMLIISLLASISAKANNHNNTKYTFIMIHFEAGYKACKKTTFHPV